MTTLALRAAGIIASAVEAKPGQSLIKRLIAAREDQAKRRVRDYLAVMEDARLRDLGFADDDIRALRAGELRLPR